MMDLFKLSVVVACIFLSSSSPSCLGASSSPKNIFILGGQSNMAGRGGVYNITDKLFLWDGLIPPASNPNPSILRFNAGNQWEEAREPLHKGIDLNKTNGVGPGMAFGNQLLARAGSRAGVIGLVPCARGGTAMTNWTKTANGTRYFELIARIKASESAGGKVRAFFWFQGESDAANEPTAASYGGRLRQFFTDLRNDLKPRFLPIIMVKIASYDMYVPHSDHNMTEVREAQEAVSRQVADVKTVDAMEFVRDDGTGYNKDRVHLNVQTEVSVGKKLADTYLSHYGQLL